MYLPFSVVNKQGGFKIYELILNITAHIFLKISQNPLENSCAGVTFEKRPWHWCFTLNFTNFLRIPFLQKASGQLLLYIAN